MPREPKCSICNDPAARVAVAELRLQAVPLRGIASRLKLAKSSIGRHIKHTEELGRVAAPPSGRKSAQADRKRIGGRCPTCEISIDKVEPEALLKRAERLIFHAETIVTRAAADEDYRLQLMAIDRVKSGLDLVMKAIGMLAPDGAVNVTIDARRQTLELVGKLSEADLRALIAGGSTSENRDAISGPETLDGSALIDSSR